MFKSLKIGTFVGLFYPKQKIYELKIDRGVMCHDNEEWCKIWRGIDLSVQNWHEELDKYWPEHSENSLKLHFNGMLLNKIYNVWAKGNTEELFLMALKIGAKFEAKMTCAF